MDMNELEREIIGLAGEARKENLPKSVVPETLGILYSHCEPHLAEQASRLPQIWAKQSRLPVFATLLLFLLFIPFFSFSSEPALNVVRIVLILFSFATGAALFFKPETMAEIDRKILGGRLSHIGPAATHSQEIVLFRVQTVYFIMISFLIARM